MARPQRLPAWLSLPEWPFSSVCAESLRVRRPGGLVATWRPAAVRGWNIDRGQIVGRGLKDVAVVMDLHELAPVGGRATNGRDGRRLEWFAEVCENLPDRPRFRGEGNEPDVTAAVRALNGTRDLTPGKGIARCSARRCFSGARFVEAEGRKASGAAVHSAASVLATPHASRRWASSGRGEAVAPAA